MSKKAISSWIGGASLLWILFFVSCSSNDSGIITPQVTQITESVYASGYVKALHQYEAYANASGPIQEIFVREGDRIKTEDPILAIYNEREKLSRENAELTQAFSAIQTNQSRLRELQLTIDLAKSTLENDSLLLARQQHLRDRNIGTEVELEQRKLAFQNSKSSYSSALLRYQDLQREIEYNDRSASKNLAISRALESDFVLKSKIDGIVYALPREKGEMVNPQTVVAVLGSEQDFYMEMQVDEYDIVQIKVGQSVVITMDSYKGQAVEGEITRIYPLMSVQTKSFTVEAKFTKAPPLLYPNLSLEANIITHIATETLVIPRSYLWKEEFVITADKDTIPVKVGIKNFQHAQILQGIDRQTRLLKP